MEQKVPPQMPDTRPDMSVGEPIFAHLLLSPADARCPKRGQYFATFGNRTVLKIHSAFCSRTSNLSLQEGKAISKGLVLS